MVFEFRTQLLIFEFNLRAARTWENPSQLSAGSPSVSRERRIFGQIKKPQQHTRRLCARVAKERVSAIKIHLIIPPPHDELLILTRPPEVGMAKQTVHNKRKQHEAMVEKLAQHGAVGETGGPGCCRATAHHHPPRQHSTCSPWPPRTKKLWLG